METKEYLDALIVHWNRALEDVESRIVAALNGDDFAYTNGKMARLEQERYIIRKEIEELKSAISSVKE